MLNFVVVKNDEVSNFIVAESKDMAEQLSGGTCIEYDNTLINPKIGDSVVDGEIVDVETYLTEEEIEAIRLAAEAAAEEEEES